MKDSKVKVDMDPALSSLFPVHQIGADGFSWWIGQVESEKGADPKKYW